MQLSSSAFAQDATIPRKYTCQGEDVSPELTIAAVPDGARSLALILEDPDAPGRTFDVGWSTVSDHVSLVTATLSR